MSSNSGSEWESRMQQMMRNMTEQFARQMQEVTEEAQRNLQEAAAEEQQVRDLV